MISTDRPEMQSWPYEFLLQLQWRAGEATLQLSMGSRAWALVVWHTGLIVLWFGKSSQVRNSTHVPALAGGFSSTEPLENCLISLSNGTLLLYRMTTDFCVLIFVPGSVTEFICPNLFWRLDMENQTTDIPLFLLHPSLSQHPRHSGPHYKLPTVPLDNRWTPIRVISITTLGELNLVKAWPL